MSERVEIEMRRETRESRRQRYHKESSIDVVLGPGSAQNEYSCQAVLGKIWPATNYLKIFYFQSILQSIPLRTRVKYSTNYNISNILNHDLMTK